MKRFLEEREESERGRIDRMTVLKMMCSLDDPLSRYVFKEKEILQLMVRILFPEENILIGYAETQSDVRNPGGESIIPDILITDINHKILIDIELQNDSRGAGIERAVKNLATLIAAGDGLNREFRGCREFCVVFITKHDTLKNGLAITHIENVSVETGTYIDDKCHLMYINCEYKENDKIGNLIHDLKCSDPDEMIIPEFASAIRKLKNMKQEVYKVMREAVEAYAERYAERYTERIKRWTAEDTKLEDIKNVMDGVPCSAEKAMEILKIPESEREMYLENL